MGLIAGFLVKKALMAGAVVAATKMEKKHNVDKIMDESELDNYLFVEKKMIGKTFYILDEKFEKKYKVTKDMVSFGEPTVRYFNMNNHELGKVYSDKSFFTKKISYYVEYKNKELGEIKEKLSVKPRYYFDFNDWTTDGDLLRFDITVFNGKEKPIIKIHEVFGQDKYIIEYKEQSIEYMAVIIFMFIILRKYQK